MPLLTDKPLLTATHRQRSQPGQVESETHPTQLKIYMFLEDLELTQTRPIQ